MVSIPNMRIAKPTIIVPISFFLSFLEKRINAAPITASIGENELGFRSDTKMLSL